MSDKREDTRAMQFAGRTLYLCLLSAWLILLLRPLLATGFSLWILLALLLSDALAKLAHALGHCWPVARYGRRCKDITITGFGSSVEIEGFQGSLYSIQRSILLAGAKTNLILAGTGLLVSYAFAGSFEIALGILTARRLAAPHREATAALVFGTFAYVNLCFAFFTLLPLGSFDGERWIRLRYEREATPASAKKMASRLARRLGATALILTSVLLVARLLSHTVPIGLSEIVVGALIGASLYLYGASSSPEDLGNVLR